MGALKIEELNYTHDDYIKWEGDWELIEGIPISMAPSPTIKHQSIAGKIITQLNNEIEKCDRCMVLGEEDYKINDDTILRPDVALICDEPNDAYITKAPEIIVEVISKSTAKRDEKYKFKIYEKEKVNYYIIVYPNELIEKVYKLIDSKYDKQGDFFNSSYTFENTTCKPTVDFDKLFRRFRK